MFSAGDKSLIFFLLIGCIESYFVMSRRVCFNHPDSICCVCGKFTPKDQRNKLRNNLKMPTNCTLDAKWGTKINHGLLMCVAKTAIQH